MLGVGPDVQTNAQHRQAQAPSPARCPRTLLSAEFGRGSRRRLGRRRGRLERPGGRELRPDPPLGPPGRRRRRLRRPRRCQQPLEVQEVV